MSATEILREDVKELIDQEGHKALRMVKAMLEVEIQEAENDEHMDEEDWEDLPKELQTTIDRAIKQVDDRGGMSHEEVVAKYYPQWFRK